MKNNLGRAALHIFQKKCGIAVKFLLCLGLALQMRALFAQQASAVEPDKLVRNVVEDVMKTVKGDPDMQAGDIKKIQQLVETKILPNADFRKATAQAMGHSWNQATAEQQAQILKEFKVLLIRTYAGAISQIRDQTVEFKPLRANPEDIMVTVRTGVINHGENVPINYRLYKTCDNPKESPKTCTQFSWKVVDINVLGAWLVEVYRSQFKQQINQGGIEGLIKFLQERNNSLINDGG